MSAPPVPPAMPPAPWHASAVRTLLDLLTPPPSGPDEPGRAGLLARAGRDVLGADAAAVLLMDDAGTPAVQAATSPAARELCALEASTGDGPAHHAWRTGRPENIGLPGDGDEGPPRRWDVWVRAAAGAGYGWAQSVPVGIPGRIVGGMVLLWSAARPPCPVERGLWTTALTTAAASVLVHERAVADLTRRAGQLQSALDSRVVIEQAKGVLAERGGLDVQTAFDRLRHYARAHRRRLMDVAGEVVTGDAADDVLTHVRPGPEPPSILGT